MNQINNHVVPMFKSAWDRTTEKRGLQPDSPLEAIFPIYLRLGLAHPN